MKIIFKGPTKFEITDGRHSFVSDQPKSSGGTDEGMNPVDIMIGSLGACIGVFISQLLVRRKIDPQICSIDLDYSMEDNPRRIAGIKVKLNLPDGLRDSDKSALLKAAGLCTIHNTLHHPPEITINI